MNNDEYLEHKLRHRDIKPTAIRLLVLHTMMRGDETVSLPELERLLPKDAANAVYRHFRDKEQEQV